MENMKVRIVLIVFICLSIFLTGCIKVVQQSPKANEGIIDLREYDTSEKVVSLNGEWKFSWNELIDPTNLINESDNNDELLIEIPHVWVGYELEDVQLSKDGFATYQLQLWINESESNRVQGIYLPFVYSAYRLWIDGELVATKGQVGKTKQESIPQTAPQVIYFQPEGETIDIVLQLSNFHHRAGGIDKEIIFGPAELISKYRDNKIAMDILIAGSLLVMGIYHFTMYFLRKNTKAPLYFGLFCMLIALRTILLGEVYFLHLFANFPWEIRIRFEYISFILGLPFFILFLQSLYPKEMSRKVALQCVVIGVIFSIIAIFTSPSNYTPILLSFQLFAVIYIALALVSITKSVIKKREGAIYTIIVATIFALTIVNDFLLYSFRIKTIDMVGYGLILFVLSQAIILSMQFSKALTRVEELSEKQRKWYQELEGKVEERTKELNQAMKDLEELAELDSLTMIPNRRKFNRVIEKEWNQSIENRTPISLILFDIDNYKGYNDTYGHLQGDECLRQVAMLITSCINSKEDLAARYGGEEFCVLLPNSSIECANSIGEKIRLTIEEAKIPHESSNIKNVLTVSVGIATITPTGKNKIDDLIKMADDALYIAKNSGRNQVKYLER